MRSETSCRRRANRLRRLWERDPRCHWCGIETVWFPRAGGTCPPNAATLDHLRSRLDPWRREPNPTWEPRTVLACWKCNNERCQRELVAKVEEQRSRSEAGKAPSPYRAVDLGGELPPHDKGKRGKGTWAVVDAAGGVVESGLARWAANYRVGQYRRMDMSGKVQSGTEATRNRRVKFAAEVLAAYMAQPPEVREAVLDMVAILADPDATADEKHAAGVTLDEALFPAPDPPRTTESRRRPASPCPGAAPTAPR